MLLQKPAGADLLTATSSTLQHHFRTHIHPPPCSFQRGDPFLLCTGEALQAAAATAAAAAATHEANYFLSLGLLTPYFNLDPSYLSLAPAAAALLLWLPLLLLLPIKPITSSP